MSPKQQAEEFNERIQCGHLVIYRDDLGQEVTTRTRTEASVLGSHTAVVWIEGKSGCVALDRVREYSPKAF